MYDINSTGFTILKNKNPSLSYNLWVLETKILQQLQNWNIKINLTENKLLLNKVINILKQVYDHSLKYKDSYINYNDNVSVKSNQQVLDNLLKSIKKLELIREEIENYTD